MIACKWGRQKRESQVTEAVLTSAPVRSGWIPRNQGSWERHTFVVCLVSIVETGRWVQKIHKSGAQQSAPVPEWGKQPSGVRGKDNTRDTAEAHTVCLSDGWGVCMCACCGKCRTSVGFCLFFNYVLLFCFGLFCSGFSPLAFVFCFLILRSSSSFQKKSDLNPKLILILIGQDNILSKGAW